MAASKPKCEECKQPSKYKDTLPIDCPLKGQVRVHPKCRDAYFRGVKDFFERIEPCRGKER